MKNIFLLTLLLCTACAPTRPTSDDQRGQASGLVSFKVWNNSLLAHQYTLIGYNPGENETGNWANGLFLLPGTYHRYSCPVGTRIYRATRPQADTVMGGGSIRNDPPFLVVRAADAGKWFPLNK